MPINKEYVPIDNQPTIKPRTVTGIFTKYIAKTLPLAFDESMSYYECICALLEYLNETIVPDINNTNDGLGELQEFYADLQNYVNTYFDNLDVQEEINNKLDQMVEDGTLDNYIGSYINPYLTSFNNRLDIQDNKIDSLASGSPLVASSTSEMTDTTRVYVNTTDGKWYYYNGTQWTIGGTYQAAEDSDSVDLLNKLSAKMAKKIQNNDIVMTKDSENLTISLKTNNTPLYIYTENYWKYINYVSPVSFSLEDYTLSSFAWAVVIRNGTFNLIKLSNSFNVDSLSIEDDDIVIGVFRLNDFITLLPDKITYNGIELGLAHKYQNYYTNAYLSRRLDISIDTDNKNITISNPSSSSSISLYIGRWITGINPNTSKTINYNNLLNSSYGNVLTILYNSEKSDFEIGQSSLVYMVRENYLYELNKNSYCEVIIGTFNIVTHEFVPYVRNNLYLNNELISDDKLNNEITYLNNRLNLLDIVNKYDFLRCFKNFTFIGDSLTAGYTAVDDHVINSATAKAQKNNWPSYLCSRLNREFTNLGFGSSTTHNWRYGDQTGQDTNINLANITTGIYFVGLGVNDLRNGVTVGSSSDINTTDYTQNVDSVYGNYDFIINKLKSFNPYAKIFVFTIPNSENNPQAINNAIKYVANLYDNVYCIDLNTLYDFSTGFIANNFTAGHYNPITYNYMSLLIEKAVNDYIFNNPTEFDLVPYNFN